MMRSSAFDAGVQESPLCTSHGESNAGARGSEGFPTLTKAIEAARNSSHFFGSPDAWRPGPLAASVIPEPGSLLQIQTSGASEVFRVR